MEPSSLAVCDGVSVACVWKECESIPPRPDFNWFSGMWWFIAAVSIYDAYLVILYQNVIINMEENPVGQYLIRMNGGDVTLFVVSKATGTLLVLGVLATLYRFRRIWAYLVAAGLSAYQFGLLMYLTVV